ncbi:unnamed protein product [Umbelopsis ramanniana]
MMTHLKKLLYSAFYAAVLVRYANNLVIQCFFCFFLSPDFLGNVSSDNNVLNLIWRIQIQACTALELARNPHQLIPILTVERDRLHNLQVIEHKMTDDGYQEIESISIPKSQHQVDATVTLNDYQTLTTLEFNASLMKEAFDSPLSIAQQENLLRMMELDIERMREYLPADRLPDLIEHNQTIATEALEVLAPLPEFSDYLQTLLTIEITTNTMEVVHRLLIGLHRTYVPDEFLHIYLSNCIRSCELIDDRSLQSRQVRLVSVFIQSLLRNNVINISDFLIEIQSFCIEFSRHRGAASLFRIVAEQANNTDFLLSQSSDLGESKSAGNPII